MPSNRPADRDHARTPSYSDELLGDPAAKPQGSVGPCDPVIEPGRHGAASQRGGDRGDDRRAADCEIEHEREETRRRTKI
ncbi:MAG TPA: hypothetical protein VFS08_15220 [Gemmatimonadaceae bacterium]|nr:hypothetical protein [Gemmatimonadaceae bacterium]